MFVITVDGDVQLYGTPARAETAIEGHDVRDGEYGGDLGGLFSVDGEILEFATTDGQVRDPVRIERTGRFERDALVARLTRLADRNRYEGDPDPRVVANQIFVSYWSLRRIRWPRWLDRRVNGDGPPRV
ncbi:hypothetical protein DX116_11700 [Aeromicrobium endophyticum]|uniref:Uncharacterized protein n=1 Tax=Aeromicrobium endophyticum TaxID=2292704 RepID=A0A371P1N1_9ACTN|nr:hypothetical protein DX116_11700 [Aeromicrobium endophyticum]